MNHEVNALLQAAKNGTKLPYYDRRLCIQHLIETGQWTSNRAMAKLFQVNESMIRLKDRKVLGL